MAYCSQLVIVRMYSIQTAPTIQTTAAATSVGRQMEHFPNDEIPISPEVLRSQITHEHMHAP